MWQTFFQKNIFQKNVHKKCSKKNVHKKCSQKNSQKNLNKKCQNKFFTKTICKIVFQKLSPDRPYVSGCQFGNWRVFGTLPDTRLNCTGLQCPTHMIC